MQRTFFILLASALFFTSCDETRRVITPIVPEGDRIILLEEFTGKGCTNCPKGSREIDNLMSLYGDNLVAVSIHAGFFADPTFFDIGQFDLRTDEGEQLFEYLAPNTGYPAGVVNRKPFNDELQLGASAWAAAITQELDQDPAVEFSLEKEWNSSSRTLTISVEGLSKANISGDLRASVMITENGIIDAQDDFDAGGIVDDYEHKHVLRDMFTKFDGDSFSNALTIGQSFNLTFEGAFLPEWDENKCDVVVFISNVLPGEGSFEVLQAGMLHVVD